MKQLITDNLAIWTTAPKGIKKLRELILELAVRGLLVPQEVNDEPASALLTKIAAEKAQLVSEGKIKPPKPLAKISEGEKPFDLPMGWEWVRLGDISTKLTDGSHNPPKDSGSGFPMLSSQNVNFGKINFKSASRFVDEIDFEKENSRTQIEPDDVLLTIVASLGRSAVVPKNAPKFIVQRSVAVIRTQLYPDFLSLQLGALTCLSYYDTHGKGTAQKGIYLGKLSLMPIIVPPLAEQQRIVAKVDELMQLCDRLEEKQNGSEAMHRQLVSCLLTTLTEATDAQAFQAAWSQIAANFDCLFTTEHSIEQLKQTILQLAVMGKLVPQNPTDEPASELLNKIATEKTRLIAEGKIKKQNPLPKISEQEKPFALPDNWEWVRISTFTQIGTGSTPSRGNPLYYSPAEISWATSGETQQDFIFETREKISPLALKETNVSVYPIGSLVVAMYGQGKTRGQVSELMIEAGTNQACAVIQFIEQSEVHRKYIKLFYKKAYEELRSNAAGGAQPNLNVGKITLTVIPLPPLPEQHRIVAKVDELMTLCEQLKTKLATTQTLQQQLAETLVQQAVA